MKAGGGPSGARKETSLCRVMLFALTSHVFSEILFSCTKCVIRITFVCIMLSSCRACGRYHLVLLLLSHAQVSDVWLQLGPVSHWMRRELLSCFALDASGNASMCAGQWTLRCGLRPPVYCTRFYPTIVRIVMFTDEANWPVCTENVKVISCLESITRVLPGQS